MKAALIVLALMAPLAGWLACYDHSGPNVPCSMNGNQPGCPDWPSDAKRLTDGGSK